MRCLREIADITPVIAEILSDTRIPAQAHARLSDMKLCLYELMSNMIIHAGRGSTDYEMYVNWCVNEGDMVFEFWDAVCSWEQVDFQAYNNPLAMAELEEHGRGLFLVQCLAEELYYSPKEKRLYAKVSWI